MCPKAASWMVIPTRKDLKKWLLYTFNAETGQNVVIGIVTPIQVNGTEVAWLEFIHLSCLFCKSLRLLNAVLDYMKTQHGYCNFCRNESSLTLVFKVLSHISFFVHFLSSAFPLRMISIVIKHNPVMRVCVCRVCQLRGKRFWSLTNERTFLTQTFIKVHSLRVVTSLYIAFTYQT